MDFHVASCAIAWKSKALKINMLSSHRHQHTRPLIQMNIMDKSANTCIRYVDECGSIMGVFNHEFDVSEAVVFPRPTQFAILSHQLVV